MVRLQSVLLGVVASASLALLSGCHKAADAGAADSARIILAGTSNGDWPGYGGNPGEDHFSPLDQINQGNVARLGLAWSVDLPTQLSTHSAPIEVGGVVYFTSGASVVTAVDAVTGKQLWSYDPKVYDVAGEKMRASWGARGLAWWNGKVIVGTADGRLVAVNTRDGSLAWSTQTTMGPNDGRYITGAPRVFNGKVIIGHGGADFAPVRGYVTAYDADTGKKLWRFFTVPGKPGTKDGEASDSIMAEAAKTWTGEWWKFGGGGTAWNAITYDPQYNRIYIGTGNGAPWNRNIRSPGGGDNWFLCGIVAVDADTGKYVWHYQTTPGEAWDYNSAMDIVLAKLKIDGKLRDVILHAPKNGFFYVIDRQTGKLISAEPFAKVTWASSIDKVTGRPVEDPQARYPTGQALVWPGTAGAHNWTPMSFSPKTGLVYIPQQEAPAFYSMAKTDPKSWHFPDHMQFTTGFDSIGTLDAPPPSPAPLSALMAWDPVAQKARWTVPLGGMLPAGVLSTGGDLVFQGNAMGKFVAYAAHSGQMLWSFDAQNGIVGQPITYSVGGKQYVTVMTGYGAAAGAVGSESARFGWDYRNQKRRLLTFVLDGKHVLPALVRQEMELVDDPALQLDMARVREGSDLFAVNCLNCHGMAAVGGGAAPDLRSSPVILSPEAFGQVVHEGLLVQRGMPRFQNLGRQELDALRQYVAFRARADRKRR